MVRLNKSASLHGDAASFLASVRAQCERFDVNAVDHYKWLQRTDNEEEVNVLELRGSPADLETLQDLTVFGKTEAEYADLRQVGKNIVLFLLNERTGNECLYEAEIRQSGYMSKAGLNFESRLYAQQDGQPRPRVVGPAVPPTGVLRSSVYFVSVAVVDEIVGASLEAVQIQRWIPEHGEVDKARFVHVLKEFRSWFKAPERDLVYTAVSREVYEQRRSGEDTGAPLLIPDRTRLIRKKFVRAKRKSGAAFTFRKSEATSRKKLPEE